MGINTLSAEFLNKYNLPFSLREDFKNSILRLNKETVDVFLGNHMQHNYTLEKRKNLQVINMILWIKPNRNRIIYGVLKILRR